MASEIKVDTISEKTSANGVTIDGVNIKDSALATAGSVPLSTIDIDGGTDIGAAIVDADLFIIDDGAGGTNRKTAASRLKTYIGGSDPASADGDTLGTASLEWSDLYLADSSVIYFGNDQDTTLTHTDGTGLTLKFNK
jgi:phage tail sheath protein FI